MKLPHWLLVLVAASLAALPVLASNLPAKWAALGPILLALAGAVKAALPPANPPAGGAS